jgi:CubicO group peptidase (beta-lactamase class C family)
VHPAGGGIFTARGLARFYAMMGNGGELDGARIMKPETVGEGTRLQLEANDFSLGTRMRRSLGLVLEDNRMGTSGTQGAGTFGHGGAGTSVGWADPSMGLAVAYITNGFRSSATNNPRLAAISRAVRAACV